MKIAVSSTEKEITSNVSDVFGRCPYFIIAEITDGKIKGFEAVQNKNVGQTGGVGIVVAQMIAEKDVDAVITKNIGPRAVDVLKQFDIKIYSGEGMIEKVLQDFMDNKLEKIE